jgi:hypothetical protein
MPPRTCYGIDEGGHLSRLTVQQGPKPTAPSAVTLLFVGSRRSTKRASCLTGATRMIGWRVSRRARAFFRSPGPSPRGRSFQCDRRCLLSAAKPAKHPPSMRTAVGAKKWPNSSMTAAGTPIWVSSDERRSHLLDKKQAARFDPERPLQSIATDCREPDLWRPRPTAYETNRPRFTGIGCDRP